ncbi:MAG TPA: acyl-CoA desaturase [Caulobacteraceae bacterium]|nr:acyl-CoA desaturase [Caulobacteraceae bacterium]
MSTDDRNVEPDPIDIVHAHAVPFVLVHVCCLTAFWTGVTWQALVLCIGLYWLRIFAIGAGYHRYFSHRAFSTSRAAQFVLAFLAQTSAQNSVLWWAAMHRRHHLFSDTALDTHSPQRRGFFYAHVGWIFDAKHAKADLVQVGDLARFPELVWLDRFELAPAALAALACFVLAGWPGLVVGFMWSTVLVYHATFCINSLAHVRGSRRYVTGDDSRNNGLLALITMGEGWHNNHHACQSSVRQGFRWWEADATFYILRVLSWIGLVWDLKLPPPSLVRGEQRLGARVIERAAEQLATRFNPEPIACAISAALHGAELAALQASLARAQNRASEILAAMHLPQVPSREAVVVRARAMLAMTPSFDEIVDRAHCMLLAAVSERLAEVEP